MNAEVEMRCHWDDCPHGANCVHAVPTPAPAARVCPDDPADVPGEVSE